MRVELDRRTLAGMPTDEEIAAYVARVLDGAPDASPELLDAVRAVIRPRVSSPS